MSVVFQVEGAPCDSGICHTGLNLLAHAQMIELSLGSECGGHGKCGRDRVWLAPEDQARVNPPTAIEKAHLGDESLRAGFRLACQCFPESGDLSITVQVPVAKAMPAIPTP